MLLYVRRNIFVVSSIITALYLLNALIALVAILIKPRDVAAIWA